MPVRRGAVVGLLLVSLAACGERGFGRQYEYDEQLYLDPDGSATVVVNASIPALIALHGLALDPAPRARIDREEVRAMVEEPGLEIAKVSRVWRRAGRQFIQISAEIDDVTKLGDTKLFRGHRVTFIARADGTREYRQDVGAVATPAPAPGAYGWTGAELTAFKLHLPSRIHAHNVRDIDTNVTGTVERGNILTWEQRLTDRLAGTPIAMHVTMEAGSILYTTLWLFAGSFGAAVLLLTFVIWRIIRRGRARNRAAGR
jgi:hypothetical protein